MAAPSLTALCGCIRLLDWNGHIKLIDLGLCKKVDFTKNVTKQSYGPASMSTKFFKEEQAVQNYASKAQAQLDELDRSRSIDVASSSISRVPSATSGPGMFSSSPLPLFDG